MNSSVCFILIPISIITIIVCTWYLLSNFKKESFLMTIEGKDESYDSMFFGMYIAGLRRRISNVIPFSNGCGHKDITHLNEVNSILVNYMEKLDLSTNVPKSPSFKDVAINIKNNLGIIYDSLEKKKEISFSFNYARLHELICNVEEACFGSSNCKK